MSYPLHQATMPNATTQCARTWTVVNAMYVNVEYHHLSQRESGRRFLILDRDKEGMIEKILELTNDAIGWPEFVICVGGNKVSCTLSHNDANAKRNQIENCFDIVEKAYGEIMLPAQLPPNKLLASEGGVPVMTYETEKSLTVSFNVFGDRKFQVPVPRARDREALHELLLEAVTLFTLNKQACRLVASGRIKEFPRPEIITVEFLGINDKTGNRNAIYEFVQHLEREFGVFKF